jgi:predicted  nucleic acid-binding Zn-ribbon protein
VAGARAAKDKHYQNTELDKALVENAEMRDEMRALQSDLDAYRDAVAELKGQLLDAGAFFIAIIGANTPCCTCLSSPIPAEEHTEEIEHTLADANGRIAELTREVQEARSSADAGQAAVEAKTTGMRA